MDSMRLIVFDVPDSGYDDWNDRTLIADKAIRECTIATTVSVCKIYSIKEATMLMLSIKERGGEGIVLRKPNIPYTPERTRDILKLKYVYEAE